MADSANVFTFISRSRLDSFQRCQVKVLLCCLHRRSQQAPPMGSAPSTTLEQLCAATDSGTRGVFDVSSGDGRDLP